MRYVRLMRWSRWSLLLCALALAACTGDGDDGGDEPEPVAPEVAELIAVTSEALTEGEPIPAQYTCDGANVSPPLEWSGVPEAAQEVVLVVDDPDAPDGTYTHWVVFALDPEVTRMEEGALPPGARQASNSGGVSRYAGPCPPGGETHLYRFTVYALEEPLDLPDGADLEPTLSAIEEAAAARGQLTGTFARG
jgi:Raf kinase inhibitor-like YbhB/YbcL family protein